MDLPKSPFLKVGANHSESFFRVRDLCMDSQKNIYALEKDDGTILKINAKGKLLKKFSGKGQGPGESQLPMRLLWVEGTLWVSDSLGYQINLFKNEQFVRSIKQESSPLSMGRIGNKIFVSPFELRDSFHVYDLEGELQKSFKVDSGFLETINPRMKGLWRTIQTTPLQNQELVIGLSYQSKIASIDQNGGLTLVWDVKEYYPSYPKKISLGLVPEFFSAKGFAEGPNGLTWVLACEAADHCGVIYQFDLAKKKAIKRIDLKGDYSSLRFFGNGSILALIERSGGVLFYQLL